MTITVMNEDVGNNNNWFWEVTIIVVPMPIIVKMAMIFVLIRNIITTLWEASIIDDGQQGLSGPRWSLLQMVVMTGDDCEGTDSCEGRRKRRSATHARGRCHEVSSSAESCPTACGKPPWPRWADNTWLASDNRDTAVTVTRYVPSHLLAEVTSSRGPDSWSAVWVCGHSSPQGGDPSIIVYNARTYARWVEKPTCELAICNLAYAQVPVPPRTYLSSVLLNTWREAQA